MNLEFLEKFDKNYIHANNIKAKLKTNLKEGEREFLVECVKRYAKFDKAFECDDLATKVEAWNEYLRFVRDENPFSSQSKFDSTILEEVMFRLFSFLTIGKIKVGNTKAYSNLYFSPVDFDDFKKCSRFKINHKDQDFAIYKDVNFTLESGEKISTSVPVVAFECKTYLDKTMLESSVATAEKIKAGNPSCRFCIVTEWYSVDKNVDIRSSRIDQIYVLKKDAVKANKKNIDIQLDAVEKLFNETMEFLDREWFNVEYNIKNFGVVL